MTVPLAWITWCSRRPSSNRPIVWSISFGLVRRASPCSPPFPALFGWPSAQCFKGHQIAYSWVHQVFCQNCQEWHTTVAFVSEWERETRTSTFTRGKETGRIQCWNLVIFQYFCAGSLFCLVWSFCAPGRYRFASQRCWGEEVMMMLVLGSHLLQESRRYPLG